MGSGQQRTPLTGLFLTCRVQMRGLNILRGAQRLGGLFVPIRTAGRSLCTSSAGVDKFPMQHNIALPNHFQELTTLRAALLEFRAEHGTANTMPTQAQLNTNGRSDLVGAISRHHGGMAAVAGRLGLEMT